VTRFAYVCADPGIPLPGTKGASSHVASVCRTLVAGGHAGQVLTVRPTADALEGAPLRKLRLPKKRSKPEPEPHREVRLFLGSSAERVAAAWDGEAPGFVYERYSLWHSGGLAWARQLGVPFVLEVNSPLPDEAARFRSLAHQDLAEGVAHLLLSEADAVVCVSAEVAAWVRARRGHDEGVWLVPNGVDAALFSPDTPPHPTPLPSGVPVIGFCSTFRPWHGLDELLEALRLLHAERAGRASLLCVGDGPRREAFEAQAAELGLAEYVHVTGALPQAEVPRWLSGADLAVAPYPALQDFYYSPLKVFEFLALGLPVVASGVGQIPELVPHEERGLLCQPGDPQGLARALARLLDDPEEARRLGAAGRAWVLEHATWRRRVEQILSGIANLREERAET
jgi:glycosyltransferase involved in cell wall biosynthesis